MYSQNVEQFFLHMKQSNYELAKIELANSKYNSVSIELNRYYQIFKHGDTKGPIPKINKNDSPLVVNLKLLNQGILYYLSKGNLLKSTEILTQSVKEAKQRQDKVIICESLKFLLEIYQRFGSNIKDVSYKYILKDYKLFLYDQFEKDNFLLKSIILDESTIDDNDAKLISLYFKHKQDLKAINNRYLKIKSLLVQANFELSYLNNPEISELLLNQAISTIEKSNTDLGLFENELLISTKINLARLKVMTENYSEALIILENIKIKDDQFLLKLIEAYQFFWLHKAHEGLGNEYESCENLNKHLLHLVLYERSTKATEVSEYETKYQAAEKEKENVLLQSEIEKEQRQKHNLWTGGSIILLLLCITGFLIYKNIKRKQLLAEQYKVLETQKLATVLKEQELKSIDAMIAGQEKERQRIANDLHDDLGSLMANVKLHFDALKDNPSPELYTKANSLIETAYYKIRGMAHAKNSGVMANKGLLKAIHEIANSNSIANKLNIQVVDYGLEQQLENSLELTIFRIIQELIANIIKHADATEATIHITNHEDTINVMVEDNGKGFNTKTISKHQGMGIHSIDKRIENLGGTVTIESEINKGTTVIIDIPTL